MFTRLDYSSALEYIIIRRYTNIVYYCILLLLLFNSDFTEAMRYVNGMSKKVYIVGDLNID